MVQDTGGGVKEGEWRMGLELPPEERTVGQTLDGES